MRDFFKSVWFKILLVILAALVGLILFEASIGNLTGPGSLIGMISQPLSQAASTVTDTVGGFFDEIIHVGKYKEENEQLRQQIADLQNQLVDYDSIKTQNDQLKEIAGIKELHEDYDVQPASVIARDPENLYGFTIGVGSLSGVEENDPVITAAGLVGLVTSVSPTYSQVTTVLSPDLQISAYDTRTGSAGVVCGRADLAVFAECQMQHLDKDAGVSSGDLIATSGSSSLFPADIVIGSVSEVTISENGMSATLTIQPSVDVQSVTDVTVIKSFTGQGSGLQ